MYNSRCDCTHEPNADKDAAEDGCCGEEPDGPHDALYRTDARTDAMRMEKRIAAFPPCVRCLWKTCRPKIYSYGIGKKLNEGHTHLPPHWELACCPTIARAYRAKCTVRYLAVEVDDELQNTRSVHG
jgi:hypothetical protein